MTTIEISLPEDLAERAKSAGLLSDSMIQQLLEKTRCVAGPDVPC
jgi:hypothetical protein